MGKERDGYMAQVNRGKEGADVRDRCTDRKGEGWIYGTGEQIGKEDDGYMEQVNRWGRKGLIYGTGEHEGKEGTRSGG